MSTTTAPAAAAPPTDETPAKGGKKKLIIIVVVVLALVGAAVYFFVLRAPAEPEEPVPGEVLTLDAIQVNLTDGHYLRLGLALQLSEEAHEADGSKALDASIGLFTGLPIEELSNPKERLKLKKELEKELKEAYHGDVMEVYFTEFVTQ